MKHLGDITRISGHTAPPVNVIIGGSPCQDLSVAGKRTGLAGERSGLFMEQIRIIKEMRENDRVCGRTDVHIRPRFMVWENVPGAFSSNKGQDFAAVLEETVKIVCEEVPSVSVPDKGWPTSGCLSDVDGKWSVAWRVLDAQFWGVPQRHRRIALVADFGGMSAPEILFERESLSGHTSASRETRERTSTDTEKCTDDTGTLPITLKIRSGCEGGGKGALWQKDKNATLACNNDQYLFQPTVCLEGNGSRPSHRGDGYKESDKMYTLNTTEQHKVAYGISAYESNAMKSNNPHSGIYEASISRTLDLNGGNPACNQGGIAVVQEVYAIENHPADSRVKLSSDGVVQSLTSRMGTGGGNTPMMLEISGGVP